MRVPAGALAFDLHGEPAVAMLERTLWLPERSLLLAADLHLGKSAAFRAHAIALPDGHSPRDLQRLSSALEATGAGRLALLGDLLHARASQTSEVFAALDRFRARHPDLEVTLVRGNHDLGAGDPPAHLDFRLVDEPLPEGPFDLRHLPTPTAGRYTLAGHVHPVVSLRGRARLRERVACFLIGPALGLLPAFGEFTGGAEVLPARGDRAFLCGEAAVIEAPG